MEMIKFLEDQLGFIFKIFGESTLTVPAMLQPTPLDPKSHDTVAILTWSKYGREGESL